MKEDEGGLREREEWRSGVEDVQIEKRENSEERVQENQDELQKGRKKNEKRVITIIIIIIQKGKMR